VKGTARTALGVVGLGLGLTLASLVAAQEANKVAPAPVAAPAPTPPVTTTVPNSPAAKALANAVTPEEAAPPKAAVAVKAEIKPEAPPPPAKTPTEPAKRTRFNASVLQAVDKITAETLRFEAKVGQPVRFKDLVLTVRSCETTAPDESVPDNIAYLDVQSQPQNGAGRAAPPRQVYRGWMFAAAPALHPFEHPIYDVWLIACKTAAPGA